MMVMSGSAWRALSRGILVFTNVLFLLLGSVLVVLGAYMMSLPDLNEFSNGGISSSLIMCGSLILLIALLGCCGAQMDSKVFLFPYTTLVVVSVLAQLTLAGFMYHVHDTLVLAAEYDFDLSKLNPDDRQVLKWINHRFGEAYDDCGLTVDLDLALEAHKLGASCSNHHMAWFATFIESKCRIGASDLVPSSTFLKCAGADFSLSNDITEHTMLCACEARMMTWANDQSLLIAVFVFTIAFFEIALVVLSCYVMCTRRGARRYGYQEIRMPVKQQQQYNPHPRNYYPANGGGGGGGDYRQPLQGLHPQQSYNSTSPTTFGYGQPVAHSNTDALSKPAYGQ